MVDVYGKEAEVVRPDVHSVSACHSPDKLRRLEGRVGRWAEED